MKPVKAVRLLIFSPSGLKMLFSQQVNSGNKFLKNIKTLDIRDTEARFAFLKAPQCAYVTTAAAMSSHSWPGIEPGAQQGASSALMYEYLKY